MVAARKTKEETVRLAKLWKKQNFMPESEKTLRAILRLDEKEFEKLRSMLQITKKLFLKPHLLNHMILLDLKHRLHPLREQKQNC